MTRLNAALEEEKEQLEGSVEGLSAVRDGRVVELEATVEGLSARLTELEEEKARNDALKSALATLKAPKGAASEGPSAAQVKAATAFTIIDLQEKQHKIQQQVETAELRKKHIELEMKEAQEKLKACGEDIDKIRSSGKAAWEQVGIKTVPYRDPFHTGLSKRTPTGGYFTS